MILCSATETQQKPVCVLDTSDGWASHVPIGCHWAVWFKTDTSGKLF